MRARNQRALLGAAAVGGFLTCILAANYLTTRYGMVSVGFGLTATAGTYFAGLTFVLRDAVQDTARRMLTTRRYVQTYRSEWAESWDRREAAPSDWAVAAPVLAVIVLGAGLSYLIAAPFIALASGIAFLAAEVADLLIYTPLRRRGYVRAAVASNVVGAVVDTFLFLWVAGFPIAGAWQGQIVGKVTVTALVVGLLLAARVVLRGGRRPGALPR